MKWLYVVILQFLVNVYVADLHVLQGFSTSNDSSDQKLQYVDNLLEDLFDTITQKKLELEDDDLWPQDFAEECFEKGTLMFDYIVVGAGTAGSVIASRLSEDPSVKVLVIEAGHNPPIQSEIHSLSLQLLNTPYTWNDYAEPNPSCCQAVKNEQCYWPRGKMIGGTGAVNGNIFLTGFSEDFDEWEQQGNKGWSWNEMHHYFTKATAESGNATYPLGSLHLNYFERLENYAILKQLMINATAEVESVMQVQGGGFMPDILGTVEDGRRMSTGKTYLAKVAALRPNLFIMKNSLATKINFQNKNQASGVEVLVNNKRKLTIRASREIILSAGTFNSPRILMLSGVGPEDHLKQLNIPVVKNLAVGENFQDHGMMPLILRFTKNIPSGADEVTAHSLYDYLMFQKGPMAISSTLIGLIKTQQETLHNKADMMLVTHLGLPTRESNVFEFLQFKDEIVHKFLDKVENQTILEIEGLIVKPKSKGSIKLKSKDPLQGPAIHNNMAMEQEDKETLLRFVRFIQELQKTDIFQYYGLELVTIPLSKCDRYAYDSDQYWLCYIKYFYISAWHAAGTCRMGPSSDSSTVLDQRLRVHGIRGLRVADASIMPNITSANTNGPTIAIAEKAAQLIKEDWGGTVPS